MIKQDVHYRINTVTNCWEWIRYKNVLGYGRYHKTGKLWLSHRYVWTKIHGDVPKGLLVCHTCDNPSCVNPDHLWLGTNKENLTDMFRKRRHPNIRIRDLIPLSAIKVLKDIGLSPYQIAAYFGISNTSVYRILKGGR